jgi:Kef-type K+ transport system membrane component KefB
MSGDALEAVSATAIRFFLQMLIIIVVYRALHLGVLRRLGQVQVVSIMITGFLLGPSVFGAVAGSAQRWLFPVTATVGGTKVVHPSVTVLYVVGQLGLV